MTSKSVHGLYDLTKRANLLTAGMTLELDMTRARIEPHALDELRTCSRSPICHRGKIAAVVLIPAPRFPRTTAKLGPGLRSRCPQDHPAPRQTTA
ncbi:hypothetical protein [Arthrobacter oryzae]|uniref:Uncharacterized protein n=1 Tax=Arthrobacter oryzae TaxID=409290 RepID=A0A3N0BQX0_9MICC|nr:hypothetical protein [Arthrobacter oryzae]RNL51356.1 hypothetical protein D7003_16300 [Arthrobacter oryzae]